MQSMEMSTIFCHHTLTKKSFCENPVCVAGFGEKNEFLARLFQFDFYFSKSFFCFVHLDLDRHNLIIKQSKSSNIQRNGLKIPFFTDGGL